MRIRLVHWLVPALALGACLTLSFLRGQERRDTPPTTSRTETPSTAPLASTIAPRSGLKDKDLARLTPLQQQLLLGTQRGSDWLYRMNGVKGRFLHGYLPALKQEMDGDSYARQAGAAFALARAAAFTGEERYSARATQAILALVDDTVVSPDAADVRHPALPSLIVNRLGAAGLLVLAINALPAPQADLLEKSEQLCNFIRRQARSDGSLRCDDAAEKTADSPEAITVYPGQALWGLARSCRHKPASWKLELLKKACAYYRLSWREHKALALVPAQAAAFSEAYLLTKDAAFAEYVAELGDWLCGLQYDRIDPRHMLWFGGFAGFAEGKRVEATPDVSTAALAGGLAEACRVVRACGDVARDQRYTDAVERALQFLATLQYTEANTQHFADWYRPRLVGGFHASHTDGNLRIDYTENAVVALVAYLEPVVH